MSPGGNDRSSLWGIRATTAQCPKVTCGAYVCGERGEIGCSLTLHELLLGTTRWFDWPTILVTVSSPSKLQTHCMPVCLCPVGAPSEVAILYNTLGLYGCHGSVSHDDHIPTRSNSYDWCYIWYYHKCDNNVLYETRCRSVGNDISGLYHSAYVLANMQRLYQYPLHTIGPYSDHTILQGSYRVDIQWLALSTQWSVLLRLGYLSMLYNTTHLN